MVSVQFACRLLIDKNYWWSKLKNTIHLLIVAIFPFAFFPETADNEVTYYTYGLKDIFTTIFYLLICIVGHAVIQEYILDVRLAKCKILIH